MGKVETQKRSLDLDPKLKEAIKKLAEHALAILDSEERFLRFVKKHPEYLERVRKEREERLKRDPLADAW